MNSDFKRAGGVLQRSADTPFETNMFFINRKYWGHQVRKSGDKPTDWMDQCKELGLQVAKWAWTTYGINQIRVDMMFSQGRAFVSELEVEDADILTGFRPSKSQQKISIDAYDKSLLHFLGEIE